MENRKCNINVYFNKDIIINKIPVLVQNDYNIIEFDFTFDREDGYTVFELKKPDSKIWVKEIPENGELKLVDFKDGKPLVILDQVGTYYYEVSLYDENQKLTSVTSSFEVTREMVNVDNDDLSSDNRLPILDDLINSCNRLKEDGKYAKEQGDYAKEKATEIINANNEATEIINGFEANVEEYTNSFNTNAERKLEEYNQNAKSCKESFDSNVKAKTTEFNDNATEKITSFNSNSISKINEFDSNATSKTDDFNNVANSETEEFNSNVLMQTNTFNKNAASKLQEYNDNATQKIEEYDAHSEELDNKIIATRNELERVKNDVLETGTDTDTYIHLEDSAYAEFQEIGIEGVIKQEITNGYQLLNVNMGNQTVNGVSLEINEDKSITINGTATERAEPKIFIKSTTDTLILKQGITYYNKTEVILYIHADNYYLIPSGGTIVPTADLDVSEVYIRVEKDETVNTTIHPMITADEEATYETYTGGQPSPSPDYPQEMEVIDESFELISCGKNRMPFYEGTKTYNGRTYKFENGTLTINGISTEENAICLFNGERTAKYVSATTLTKTNSILFPAGTYKISRVNVENGYSIGIKHGKLGTVGTDTYIGSEYNKGTFVLNKAEWVTLLIYDFTREEKQVIMKNFQIERNPTVTEYEPYQSTKAQITVPENEFVGKINDNIKDKFRLAFNETDSKYHLYLDKVITKRILNNTNTWELKTDQMHENTVLFTTTLTDVSNEYSTGYVPMKCNRFTTRVVWGNIDVEGCMLQSNNSVFMVRINKNRLTELTVDAFKTWVSNNQLITYYAVRNPYTLDLGVIDMPLTYYPITNVFTTCDLLPIINVAYYRSFKETIKPMQDDLTSANMEIDTLKNEVNALKEQVAQLMTSTILEESEAVE